jgi:hypothetical protein
VTQPASSNFDAFNARSLDASEVARTFVPSLHFDTLIKRRHTIVLGPRGSGKTTLLKMLQGPALRSWQHPLAADYRDKVDFTGVFIATDISWGEQITALGSGRLDSDSHRLLSVATFTTHVLRALIVAMLDRVDARDVGNPYRGAKLSAEKESVLVGELSKAWHLRPTVPSLLSLKQALSGRLHQIRDIASRESVRGTEGRSERLANDENLHLHFVQSCSLATELFDDVTSTAGKWALMFDELELAPAWINEELVKSLRSTDSKLLFKLALNPYSDNEALLGGALSAAPGQDFDQIPLWYPEKRDAQEFCTALWYQMLSLRNLPAKAPKAVLGNSYFETTVGDWEGSKNAYGPKSKVTERFSQLAEKDATFRDYLRKNRIDVKHMNLLSGDARAATVRKIAPIVALREFYRRSDRDEHNQGGERSRKRATLYSGADSLFAISEGNPRWLIGILSRLLDRWDIAKKSPIPPAVQAQELQKAAERFAAMLKTLPNAKGGSAGITAFEVVKQVSKYIRKEVVSSEFRPEPPGTFVVNDDVDEATLISVRQALNAGALVYVPTDEGQLILTSLKHKRFRVAYLLAPLYGTPIRLGKEMSLSTILGSRIQRARLADRYIIDHPTLFTRVNDDSK